MDFSFSRMEPPTYQVCVCVFLNFFIYTCAHEYKCALCIGKYELFGLT